ncbi:lantibiotic dehydratase [Chitinophaga filiformis]|uniref:Thiopeptide-type bacteriocin biosynthesis domain-containing protein n=1 Tax=Chitinophaga filiformis TaxID=104663 RepID=A0A1G7RUR1_CHIFI|nr:lantibiotic dehydratase [Chitinophaga filiformis]SDG14486.1 thiopeptide-type bacteriocin biosynthesis domain-containing protein [Chitinophaga filiformis]
MQDGSFKDYGKVVIRTPLYSYACLFDQQNKTLDLDKVVFSMLGDPVFVEGLYWSSPQLYETVLEFKNGNLDTSKHHKLMHTLKKYAIRASTRSTPYGIYAGCTLVDIDGCGERADKISERKVRIDMGLLQQIIKKVEKHPALWVHLRYQVNDSLYHIAGQYRFIETIVEDGKYQHQISSIDHTDLLERIIALIRQHKAVTIAHMYAALGEDNTYEEFEAFAGELVETQFLVSELQLGLTIGNELERIHSVLERLMKLPVAAVAPFLNLFEEIQQVLRKFEDLPLGVLPVDDIGHLETILKGLDIEVTQRHIFHADLKQPAPARFVFPRSDLKEMGKAIAILSKLSHTVSPVEVQVDRFKKRFTEKYETQEVSLAEVLDPEFGIGFPATDNIGNVAHNSLAEKMNLPAKKKVGRKTSECNAWLQDRIESWDRSTLRKGIQLQDKDFEKLEDKSDQLANYFTVMGACLPSGDMLLQHIGGAHANILLGRFAHLEEEMNAFCRELADDEMKANKHIAFAEIIHIPEGRVSNIARRERFYDYEIPFLGASALAGEGQLTIEDMMVSIQRDEIILRSRKWNKRVIPRLSNAHNYANSSIAVYKFLASLQHQGKSGFEINWGSLAQYKRFLPRISYKHFILHRATWFLRESDMQDIMQADDQLAALRLFLSRWEVAKLVCFCEGDNELFIDTENETYLQVLLKEMKGCSTVKLVEWLWDNNMPDEGKNREPFVQQFILPLAKQKPVKIHSIAKEEEGKTQRVFEPGSEWVYFKIFCGAKASDTILLKVVKPVIDFLVKKKMIDRAFFIRYTDPHYHIRFRLHLVDNGVGEQYAAVTKYIYDILHPYLEDKLVWKVQQDTYQREIERYGDEYMLLTEEIFFHDSLSLLACLEEEDFEDDEQIRFLTSVKNMDNWLSLYGLSLEERIAFCTEMSDAFAREFGRDIKRQVNAQYQEWRRPVADFLNSERFNYIFAERTVKLACMGLPLDNISSYIHMSMNRWFTTEQRFMEYMAYSFCGKYYNQIVHQKNGAK